MIKNWTDTSLKRLIIELVDSTCKDSAYTQHMIIQKNLKNGKLVSLYDNIPYYFKCFMTYNTPSSVSQKYQTRKSPDG